MELYVLYMQLEMALDDGMGSNNILKKYEEYIYLWAKHYKTKLSKQSI